MVTTNVDDNNLLPPTTIISSNDNEDSSKFEALESSLSKLKKIPLLKKDNELFSKLPKLFRIGSKRTLADRIDETNLLAEKDVKKKRLSEKSSSSFLDLLMNPITLVIGGFAALWTGGWIIKSVFGDEDWKAFNDVLDEVLGGGETGYESLGAGATTTEEFAKTITQYESKQKGYNASYNNWAGNEDLTKKSVEEVLAMQTEAKRSNPKTITKDGRRSSAIGLYQVTGDTLEGLVKSGKINKSAKFDKVTQDKIGWEVLLLAGFLRYVKDQSYEDEFIKRLIGKWEGLKNMSKNQIIAFVRSIKNKYIGEKFPQGKKETPDVSKANVDELFIFTKDTGDRSHFDRLESSFKAKIIQLASSYKKETGEKLVINSAFRSAEEQKAKSRSMTGEHMVGKAVDVPIHFMATLLKYTKELGLDPQIHYNPLHCHIQSLGVNTNPKPIVKKEVKKETPKPISKESLNTKNKQATINNLANDKNIVYNQNLIPTGNGLELYKSEEAIMPPSGVALAPASSNMNELRIVNIDNTVTIYPKQKGTYS